MLPRLLARRAVRTLGVVSASVLAFPVGATAAHAAIPTPKPTRSLPSALDAAPPYQKGVRCLSSALPGPVAFAKLLNATYGTHVYGILRTCAAEHGEGRALDWMLNAKDPASLALGNTITRWLAAPDSQGRQGAMARRLGINYIIWNRQQWKAWDPSRGWAPYYGVSSHTDHIHISFTWDGAYARNSWWTGKAITDYLTGPLSSTSPPAASGATASGYPWLRQGASGTDVKLAQKVVGAGADGRFGPLTASALARWQSRYGVRATKELDNATWTKMVSLGAVPSRANASLKKYAGTTLRRGSRGDAVKALQKAVGKLTVDGSYGPATEGRVKDYQRSKGLSATGVTDAKVWHALMGASTSTAKPATSTSLSKYASVTLRLWSRGDAVKALQKAVGKLTVDGSYGKLTEARVRAYQKSKGLAVTGVTDAKVWKALMGASSAGSTTKAPSSSTSTEFTSLKATTLRSGSSGSAVKALQRGVGGLAVDGSFGPRTLSVVKAFQKSAKLSVTGVVDRKAWDAIERKVHPLHAYWGTVLKRGSRGTAVTALQRGLHITADGSFGPQTEASVRAAQKSAKLTRTGVVGTVTWKAVEARMPR